ncbi:hypothetical protein RBB50_005756 [Rhinocladiella similis]
MLMLLGAHLPQRPYRNSEVSPSSDSQRTKDQAAAAAIDDVTGGFTTNERAPETDTSTITRGAAADDVVGGESDGDNPVRSDAAAERRHQNPDVEPPRRHYD